MEDRSVREIARHLAPLLAGGTDDEDRVNHLRVTMFRGLEVLPEPEPGTIWLPDGKAEAYWLTDPGKTPHLLMVNATVAENPKNAAQPFATLTAKGLRLDDHWSIRLESEYGGLAPDAGFRTRWTFEHRGQPVLTIDGERKLAAVHCEEWLTDSAEEFARLFAAKVGWPLEALTRA